MWGACAVEYQSLIELVQALEASSEITKDEEIGDLARRTGNYFMDMPGRYKELGAPEDPLGFYKLARTVNNRKCEDPRDMIFGIHSLFTPTSSSESPSITRRQQMKYLFWLPAQSSRRQSVLT